MSENSAPADAPASEAATPAQYEFGEAENAVFRSLSSNLRVGGWGVLVMIVAYHAVLLGRWAATGVPMYDRFRFGQVWWPLVLAVTAVLFVRAGRAFGRVAETQGSDVTHLMDGLRALNESIAWLPIVWVFIAIAAAAGAVVGVLHVLGY